MKSWRDVPEFAGAEISDCCADGTPIPFKKGRAKDFRLHLQRIGEPVLQVVIGRGDWSEVTMIIARTPSYLLIAAAGYWELPVPTHAPKTGIANINGLVSAQLTINTRDSRGTGFASKFPVEPLFRVVEGALPQGTILTHPLRAPAPTVREPAVTPSPALIPPAEVARLSEDYILMRQRITAPADLELDPDLPAIDTLNTGDSAGTGWPELRPRGEIDWDGPVRDFEDSERFAAAHMRYLGFADAVHTDAGADSGVDVESIRAVAQVKFHAKPIGSPGLQNLRGVAWQKEFALFYSLSGYTQRALDWAETNGITLFTYTRQGTVRASNAAARALEQEARDVLARRRIAEQS